MLDQVADAASLDPGVGFRQGRARTLSAKMSPEVSPTMHPPFAICRDGEPVPESLKGAVAAIGNFDGVHRGHQHLLDMALNSAGPARLSPSSRIRAPSSSPTSRSSASRRSP